MLSSVVSPVMACGCSTSKGMKKPKVAVIELKGLEKNEAIAKALKNEEVRKLTKQLRSDGFSQEGIKVYKLSLKDGSQVLVVEISFKSANGQKSIIYAYNPRTGDAVTILASGWDCIYCLGLIAGCAACAEACAEIGPACIECLITAQEQCTNVLAAVI